MTRVLLAALIGFMFMTTPLYSQEAVVLANVASLDEAIDHFIVDHPALVYLHPWKKELDEVAWCQNVKSGLVDHRLKLSRRKSAESPGHWDFVGRYEVTMLFHTKPSCRAYRR